MKNEITKKYKHKYEYIEAVWDGRTDDAKHHLLASIAEAGKDGFEAVRVTLAQNFGNLCFAQGDELTAIFIYEISEFLDKGSLLAKLNHAKFLFQKIKDKKKSINKCDEIIKNAQEHPFPSTDEDFGSQEYLNYALQLKKEIQDSK
jgi:hypothetical protein